jgi:hypothetical protein
MTRIPGQLLVVCVERRSLPISEPVDTSCLRRYHARSVLPRNDTVAAASRARLKFGFGSFTTDLGCPRHVWVTPGGDIRDRQLRAKNRRDAPPASSGDNGFEERQAAEALLSGSISDLAENGSVR